MKSCACLRSVLNRIYVHNFVAIYPVHLHPHKKKRPHYYNKRPQSANHERNSVVQQQLMKHYDPFQIAYNVI